MENDNNNNNTRLKRYLTDKIKEDLKKKMVFLGGPRQVGKTFLSYTLIGSRANQNHPAYLNWDITEDKKNLIAGLLPAKESLVVFDEIHKYKDWRNLMKGFYDQYRDERSFLVTGSARLDYYRHGGDSLQGRYFYYRLHPLSLLEINKNPSIKDVEELLKWGGFPEPFLCASSKDWMRWQKQRQERVIQEDLVSLENVKEIETIKLLVAVLPSRVSAVLSLSSLARDLHVSHATIERWISILENLYFCFRVAPFVINNLRTAKKEKKLYLWDWSICHKEKSVAFENLVASQLLKYCHFIEDTEGHEMKLTFLRDAEGREIDFVVVKDGEPLFAVECKSGERAISEHIAYFAPRSKIPLFYQVHLGKKDMEAKDLRTRVLPFTSFCQEISSSYFF